MRKTRFLILLIILFAAGLAFAEEIKLTTIVPDQTVLRAKKGAIGENYSDPLTVPDSFFTPTTNTSLVVEKNVCIGTSNPPATTDAETKLIVQTDDDAYGGAITIQGKTNQNKRLYLGYDTAGNYGKIYALEYGVAQKNLVLNPYGGDVGIGTTGPLSKLDVAVSSDDQGISVRYNGDTIIGAQLVKSSKSGVLKLANDIGTQTVQIHGRANQNSYFNSGGNVGIGMTAPGYKLTVNGTAWCTSGTWSGSDLRWKENIATLSNPLQKLLRLRAVSYDWKQEEFKANNFPEGRQIGIIAQELEKEFPELVITNKEGYKAIAYDRFTAVLLGAIKAQQKRIEALEAKQNDRQ